MSTKTVDPPTLKQVHDTLFSALEPLEQDARRRVLASVTSLLGMDPFEEKEAPRAKGPQELPEGLPSLRDLVKVKEAVTISQKIAVFAYYREKGEGKTRFSRDDLEAYFEKAKESPPSNYDRDFMKAVDLGWIHENEADSYLTSKGLEAVEAGFGGRQPPRGGNARRTSKRSNSKSRTKAAHK